MSIALLTLRLVLGGAMAAHGAQKLFGWFGGGGLERTGDFFEGLGFYPGVWFAEAAGLAECASGALVALGLLGPVGPALMTSVMVVAIFAVHRGHGFFALSNGAELPVLYIAGAIALAVVGHGHYSLDYLLDWDASFPEGLAWAALAVGLLAACGNLALRHASGLTNRSS